MAPSQQHVLITEHMRFARVLANRYARRFPWAAAMREDLISEATLGLCEAAAKYDPTTGIKFGAFAYWYISDRIKDFAHQTMNPVKAGLRVGTHERLFIDRGPMPVHVPGGTGVDEERMDRASVAERVTQDLLLMRANDLPNKGQRRGPARITRDVELFLRARFEDHDLTPRESTSASTLSAQYGLSRERVRQICARIEPLFEALAKQYQQEAA